MSFSLQILVNAALHEWSMTSPKEKKDAGGRLIAASFETEGPPGTVLVRPVGTDPARTPLRYRAAMTLVASCY